MPTPDSPSFASEATPIPEALIYERTDQGPIYYRGYQAYLQGKSSMEAIMGSSYLQSFLIMALIRHLIKHLPEGYELLANEVGVFYEEGKWRSLDLAVFHREDLKGIPLTNTYLQVPPRVVIEVDTKADFGRFPTPMDYVHEKTDNLLAFGVEKVIWIFTGTRKVLLATPDAPWQTANWSAPISVIAEVELRLEEMIAPIV